MEVKNFYLVCTLRDWHLSTLHTKKRDIEEIRLIEKGDNVLTKLYWSDHSLWNWESKMVLLEAEKMLCNW